MNAATPGQAAYEAYVMAAPDDMNFPVPDSLDAWERDAWEAAGKAGYEQRCQNDAAQQPQPAPELASVMARVRRALEDSPTASTARREALEIINAFGLER